MSDDRKAVRYRYALARLEDHLRGVWTYPSQAQMEQDIKFVKEFVKEGAA